MLKKYLPLILIIILQNNLFAQFKIDQLPSDIENLKDSLFLGISKTRSIQYFNKNWKIFFVDEPEKFSQVSFPLKFTSKKIVIFEKEFSIAGDKLTKNIVQLNFLGLNYSAEIFLNNATIYKHAGGEIPFEIELPESILNYDSPNTLRIKIQYDLNSETTIPLMQRFLFPTNFGGIFRDVYLSFKPKLGVKDVTYNLVRNGSGGNLNFSVFLQNFSKIKVDSTNPNFDGNFKIQASIKFNFDTSAVYNNTWNINSQTNKSEFSVPLAKIVNWKPNSPKSYIVKIILTNSSGVVLDELSKNIALVDIKKSERMLKVDGNDFLINGVTYIRSNLASISSFRKIELDIKKIKEAGFNTVRFSKTIPHPYAIYLCEKYGLFSLIELPLNSVPEKFTSDVNFRSRVSSFLNRVIKYYDKYNTVIGLGAGGSFIRSSQTHGEFIVYINKIIKSSSPDKFTYASFFGNYSNNIIDGLDLYGIEVYGEEPSIFFNNYLDKTSEDSSFYFISEATYPTYNGGTNGYLNENSYEGQAKFFDGIIDITNESNLKGFVLNSMFDYQGDFAPLFSGYSSVDNYAIGILPQNVEDTRLSFNVIKSRLNNGTKTSIPIGNSSDDAPIIFIIAALLNSIIIALLINSKRKFREDTMRALLRPYNFYSDIRDQRILNGFHSNILMFLLSGSNALLVSIILYHLKSNILFEKIIIAFGNYKLSSIISYLAWNPIESFLYIYVATIILFFVISILFHLSSFFVKNRILFSSVYSVAIWAFLPMALLVPIETILYKILELNLYNIIIYFVLFLFIIWIIQRFLKGIYVIFDVRPFLVYLYSYLLIIIIAVSAIFYLQYFSNTIDYITLALRQFSLI